MILSKQELEDLIAGYIAKIAKARLEGESKAAIDHYEKELRLLEMAYDDYRTGRQQ